MDKFVAAAQKLKLIDNSLNAISEVVALISPFITDESKIALVQGVLNNIDVIKEVMITSGNTNIIAADLIKGNYLGNRKIDIDLSLNKSSSDVVSYSQADIILADGTKLSIPFLSGESILELTSHNDIRNYIISHALWVSVNYTECTVEEATSTTNTLIRFRDADGHSSNIERIELTVYSGTANNIKPRYFWANSTSALQTIANRVGDIIALGNDIEKIVTLSQRIDELVELQNTLASLLELHTNLTELLASSTYAQTASTKAGEASQSASAAATSATNAATSATSAANSATTATQKANEIKAITVQSNTLSAGSAANVSYNSADGKFTFGIPQGLKGDKGDAFNINAVGTLANRTNYDTQPRNFTYLATDVGMVYFKNSDTSADWSTGVAFGKGDTGDTGATGDGINSFTFLSTTDASGLAGQAGASDTYRITMTSGNTFDYVIYNGTESDVNKAYVDNLIQQINTILGEKADATSVNNALTSLDEAKAPIANPVFTGSVGVPIPTASGKAIPMGAILEKTPVGMGYGSGAGGTVTQATSKSTAVTLNKPCGVIAMNSASLAAGASVTFVLNNSLLSASDCIDVTSQYSVDNYKVEKGWIQAGVVRIRVTNINTAALAEPVTINFTIIKGATA